MIKNDYPIVNEDLFFKQATLLICSSLDIETALQRCRAYIYTFLPAGAMYINIYEPALGGLRYVARADARGGEKMDKVIRLPRSLIVDIEQGRRLKDQMIINQPELDPMGRILAKELDLDLDNFSLMTLRLRIEGQRLGVIDIIASGRGRFTDDQMRLFSLLHEPFAIAMANTLKHQELLKLKEQLVSENRFLSHELFFKGSSEVIGADQGLKGVLEKVRQVAPLRNTVLILGETGVGKEVIANAIHRLSNRKDQPFIKVNCGAIPENLIDSELFGHEKGAFTGAVSQKRGRFERANQGTIFLDEIGELPSWAQVRLLRVLQTREIERLGGSPPIPLDIRVIVATHRNLGRMVEQKQFRQDLWFRINAFPIVIPPLRERKADIPLLVDHFLKKKATEMGIQKVPHIMAQDMERLMAYDFPGNVRELENNVERALIQHRHGPLHFGRPSAIIEDDPFIPAAREDGKVAQLDDVVKSYIEKVLAAADGRVNGENGAAAMLGINPNTLRHRMKKLGIVYGREYTSQKRELE